jgi:hypothetical protein
MSPRIGDGNNYGNFAGPNEVSGFSASGQFILENKNPHRQARDAQRQGFLDSHQAQKAAELNQDSIRQQVWWADGDLDKLNAILVELGGHPQKYASTAERAINKKLSALEHTYAGKTVLSLDERAALAQQWDWENLSGVTQHEVNRLNQLANGPYNSQFQRPITPQPSGAYKGAQVPPDIQERLDALQGEGGLRRRQQEQNPKAYTNRTPKPTERSERMTEKRDKEVTQQRTSRYQPKLSEEEKARRRAGRPLRPRDLRVNR